MIRETPATFRAVSIVDSIARLLRGGRDGQSRAAAGVPSGVVGISSPWTDQSGLEPIVLADMLGIDLELPVTRADAQAIPALGRARDLLTTDASRCPLRVWSAEDVETQAGWLQRGGGGVSPQHRIVWTVDDLFHYGWSLWLVQREEPSVKSPIQEGIRCPFEWWGFTETGGLQVHGKDVPEYAALLIPGFHEGVLVKGRRTIRAARELEQQAADRSANPIPVVEIHQETGKPLTKDERRDLVRAYQAAMKANQGVISTPPGTKVIPHGQVSADLLIQGRNAAAIDAARHAGVPAAMVDASNVNSTLTYETLQGRNLEYVDHSLALYLGPIESRLSLDDVTAPGSRVRADTSAITANPSHTGTTTED